MASVDAVERLVANNSSNARQIFGTAYGNTYTNSNLDIGRAHKRRLEYADTFELPPALASKLSQSSKAKPATYASQGQVDGKPTSAQSQALIRPPPTQNGIGSNGQPGSSNSLIRRDTVRQPKPQWHPPWKLMRVISGHLGWVRSVCVEPDNQWFATGAGDRTIKIWDLASGTLKLTLTGHISTVRGLGVSNRHPYLFSCGEDKMVKCWDLETNKVIRHYHGHLSGVYALDIHPTMDILGTAGRDGVVRIWDMRTRSNIHVLSGHKQTVTALKMQEADPQVISGSLDSTVRLWDLAAGKSMGVLTHHKKGVRALATHPQEFTFASASTGAIKQWKCPEGQLMQNFDNQGGQGGAHNAIINTLAVNEDNVLVSGGDDGSLVFWDWQTGVVFQRAEHVPQPGSLDAEAGVMSATFDQTGLRYIQGCCDKTIQIWKQDEDATEESNPVEWAPTLKRRKY